MFIPQLIVQRFGNSLYQGSEMGTVLSVNISSKCDAKVCHLVEGKNVDFSVKFIPKEVVTSSKAVIKGELPGIPIKVNFPLPNSDGCKNSGLTCPLKSGQSVEYSSQIFVKTSYPAIDVVVLWSLLDQNKKVIWCVALPVKLEKP